MIIVCSLNDFSNVCESIKPTHAISVIDPGFAPKTPDFVKNHLILEFHDIVNIDDEIPINVISKQKKIKSTLFNKKNAYLISEFIKNIDINTNIVIHCWCGVSRSMATATFLMCNLDKSNVVKNVKYIRSIAPHAQPNKLMMSYFEELLDTNGNILSTFEKNPCSITYDCQNNFAPVTIFDINDMKKFL